MTTVNDNFDRAASTGLGANWVEESGDFEIAGSTLIIGTAGASLRIARWAGTALASNDYYVEAGSARVANSNYASGVIGRQTTGAVTGYIHYLFGGDFGYISYYNAGAETVLATGAAVTASTAYTVRIRISGSGLSAYRNGAFDVAASHATLTTGNVGACFYGGNAGSAQQYIDNWEASDLAAGTGAFWGKLLALQTNRLVVP